MDSTYPLELLVGKANAVLYANLIPDAAFLAQNGNTLDLDAVFDDAGRVAAYGDRSTLHTCPGTDSAAPANNRMHNAGIMPNLCVFEDNRILHASTRSNHDSRANRDIRA